MIKADCFNVGVFGVVTGTAKGVSKVVAKVYERFGAKAPTAQQADVIANELAKTAEGNKPFAK